MSTSSAQKTNPTGLQQGDKAPDFTLPVAEGESVSLKDFKGQNIVLYFYPKDSTPGCTTEAQDFRDLKDEFEKQNTVILGVSRDDLKSHAKFTEKQDINFPLGSDEAGQVCEDYGVWVEKNMYGRKYMGIQRATFLIDQNGTIARIWPKVKVKGHAAEVLEAVKELA